MKKTYIFLNLSSILIGLAIALFHNKAGFIRYYVGKRQYVAGSQVKLFV